MEDNKKNKRVLAVLAVVAVVAIAFAGIGYAYTATTVSTSNSVASEDILVTLYGINDDEELTEKYDYSEDVQKVKYNNYIRGMDAQGEKDIVYGVAEDAQILSINTIVLKSEGLVDDENPTGEKQLKQLTLILSQDLFADGTYEAKNFEVKLTSTDDKVWTGVNDGKTWVFTLSDSADQGENLIATDEGSAYALSFVLKADPEMDLEVLGTGTAEEAAEVEKCYPHDKKLEEVIDSTTPLKIFFVAESFEA